MQNSNHPKLTLSALLTLVVLLAQSSAVLAQNKYTLPLFISASHQTLQGFARIINRSGRDGTVTIHATDDAGRRSSPVTLSLGANATQHFNSDDLRDGDAGKGLSGGVGTGQGNWRLELETDLDIIPLVFSRPKGEGFVTSSHDVADGASMRWHVVFFNPGSNTDQQSWLRVVNTSGIDTEVTVRGLDDNGDSAAEDVHFELPADASRMLSAQELELGSTDSTFDGRLGDGAGKWQLFVSANRPILVMSLLLGQSGNLTNLSTVTRKPFIRGGPGSDTLRGGNGDDVLDPGDNDGGLDIIHGSAGDDRIHYTSSGPAGIQVLDYSGLGTANISARIFGDTNVAAVSKRFSAGNVDTDTIEDISNPLRAAAEPFHGGFELRGTRLDDKFTLSMSADQRMVVDGNAGDDTFDIRPGGKVTITYQDAPGNVDVDLPSGAVIDYGFGNRDTIIGDPWGVIGSDSRDIITGSGKDEWFMGRAGRDTIDGGGGTDWLAFGPTRSVVDSLSVDLANGRATGTWDGMPLSYTLSNIENVRGGDGNDTLFGDNNVNVLDGGPGDDRLNPGDVRRGFDKIVASVGNDRIDYANSGRAGGQDVDYSALYAGGITATVDGARDLARVVKGIAGGTDEFENVVNALHGWGLRLTGTRYDDVFNVDLDSGQRQFIIISPGPGNDTVNIEPDGEVIVSYWSAPRGVVVSLLSGTAPGDGYGTRDTFTGSGRITRVVGSKYTDFLEGSNNSETFLGAGGDDIIHGHLGGSDRLIFSSQAGVNSIDVDLRKNSTPGVGTVTGSFAGKSFTYEVHSIEHFVGGRADDSFRDEAGNHQFDGGDGDDLFIFYPEPGDDIIGDFSPGDDTIVLKNFGRISSKSQVLNAVSARGSGVLIDLRPFGGGTIELEGVSRGELRASDFLL